MEIVRSLAEPGAQLFEIGMDAFDLDACVCRLREVPAYEETGRNAEVLVKAPDLRLVLRVLRAGQRLPEHCSRGRLTIQVLEGEVRFGVGEDSAYLVAGQLLHLPDRASHTVEALADSAFLLTVVPEQAGK
jgi:quercetin dioxygenase-like cupin family protein